MLSKSDTTFSYVIGLIVFLTTIGSAHAEVMDKEPSFSSVIIWGALSSVACFLAARYKPILLLVIPSLPTLYFVSIIMELSDPHVGPAIKEEAGAIYVISVYVAAAGVVLFTFLGLLWSYRSRQHNNSLNQTGAQNAPPG